jgi:hypothetical protein
MVGFEAVCCLCDGTSNDVRLRDPTNGPRSCRILFFYVTVRRLRKNNSLRYEVQSEISDLHLLPNERSSCTEQHEQIGRRPVN